ncbi:NADP-dependent oxidoreductase [Oenococcus sicerae]|uniref:NADP-dependent oxidoreductase n=1 Tax=Oenococcus sicerae TaxID=2203724 RepID=A0ABX5QK53_9LACO|nr:NADP-dependent oxidoreductase [Oenococcus sicerae]QAS69153.1 NADP-dependent oxidoreductase [Oenococcus sicerae]
MKAIEINKFGDVDVFYETEKTPGDLKSHELLIKNYATAIDPYDVKYRAGAFDGADKLPTVLGSSVAGIVEAIGSEVTQFTIGDRVAASTHLQSYARQVIALEKQLALIPDNVTFVQAAGVALGYQTGYQGITKELDLQKGQSILIHGGSGSVGFAAIQAAKNSGATKIYATASDKGKAFLTEFDPKIIVFDYKKDDFTKITEKVDAVLDTVGGNTQEQSLKVLKSSGKLRSTVNLTDNVKNSAFDAASYYLVSGQTLSQLLLDLSRNRITIKIAHMMKFNLENLKKSHQQFETGHPLGKIILEF